MERRRERSERGRTCRCRQRPITTNVQVLLMENVSQLSEAIRHHWCGSAAATIRTYRHRRVASALAQRHCYYRSSELRSSELRSSELRSSELRSSELRSSELRSSEFRSSELRLEFRRICVTNTTMMRGPKVNEDHWRGQQNIAAPK